MAKTPTTGVALRKAWRALVPPSLRRHGQAAAVAMGQRRVEAWLANGEAAPTPGPVVVSGLVSGTKGVSRAAQLTAAGLRSAGYSPIVHDLAPVFSAVDASVAKFPTSKPGGVWLLHVNAPEAIAALSRMDPAQWLGRHRIAYWAYELPRVPKVWIRASRAFHEIWTPSRFVADALFASGITTPSRVMPHPVMLRPRIPDHVRTTDDFIVLAMGDLQSSAERKNLVGAIEIYARAFPHPSPGRKLILKLQSEDAHPEFRKAARAAAAGRSDITFETGRFSDAEIGQLIATSSVLLSPHRSEGFGLTLAEAFAAGVPALATGWSGNVDFMASLPELLIDYKLVAVRDRSRIYRSRDLRWAEPDIDDAVAKLRVLAASPALRSALAARGRTAIEAQLDAWSRASVSASSIGRFSED